jgi:cytochrome d ubiquinol oxidase subunit II
VNEFNLSQWKTPFHGLEAVLNVQNISLGLAVLLLARVLGLLYLINTVDNEQVLIRARKQVWYNAIPFVVFFLLFAVRLLFIEGFAVDPSTGEVFMEPNKYLHNFLQMPLVLILFLVGVLLVLWGILSSLLQDTTRGIWFSGAGTTLTVFSLFLLAGFNNTAFYPSTFDLQSSLTIQNASSSKYTLTAMSYVSLLVPFVIAYIWYAWRSINRKKITEEEMNEESHAY